VESDRFVYDVESTRIVPLTDYTLTERQGHKMQMLERADPGARVIGWLPEQGPLVVCSNGDWQSCAPDGRWSVIARGHYS
jgi:hypothetical protein